MGGSGNMAMAAAASYVQAVGTLSAGIAQKRAYRYTGSVAMVNAEAQRNALEFQATIAERNQQLAEEDQELALQAAAFREQQLRLYRARQQGQVTAAYGASGAVIGVGSPLEQLVENAYQIETEALLTRYQGQLEARARGEEAAQFGFEAQLRRYEGRQAMAVGRQQMDINRFLGRQAELASYIKTASDALQSASGSMGGGGAGGGG